MATPNTVKRYLAYWLQMGKKINIQGSEASIVMPQVVSGEEYSLEFEQLWQRISKPEARLAYLEGTVQTVHNLLDMDWEIIDCPYCSMPLPCVSLGPRETLPCPCDDLSNWPNLDTIQPRLPVNNQKRLSAIYDRLELQTAAQEELTEASK